MRRFTHGCRFRMTFLRPTRSVSIAKSNGDILLSSVIGRPRWVIALATLYCFSIVSAPSWGQTQDTERDRAILKIKKHGGALLWDNRSPYRSIVGINFAGSVELPSLNGLDEALEFADVDLDDVTSEISEFKELKILDFFNRKISDAGLAHLAGLTNLRELNLGATQVGDAGLAHLAGLTNLRKLDLGGTRVDDAGLAHLAGLSNLASLSLSNTRIEAAIHA